MTRFTTRALITGRSVHYYALAQIMLLACALAVYATTLDNGLQPHELRGGDLITHQYAQVEARPSNAPGYPLYTMGGWLWFHGLKTLANWAGIAHPNPIPILSSYSTLWALLALWLLFRIICHLTATDDRPHGNWLLAWLLCAFYGFTYFFWYYATTTEQYSSAVAQTLAIVYVYLLWQSRPARSNRLLFLMAFLCGLALAHMLTVAFIVPALVAVILWDSPHLLRNPRVVSGTVIAAMIPLASYAYVYLRGADHPEWWGNGSWPSAQAWFWSFLSTAQGRQELLWGFEPGRAFFGNGFPELIWHELSVPLLLLGMLGIACLPRKTATLFLGTLSIYVLFCWAYRYGNWFQVILPAYPLVLVAAAIAVDQIEARLPQLRPLQWLPRATMLTGLLSSILLMVAIVWRMQASLPAANSHNRPQDTALNHAAILLDQPIPRNTGLFATLDDALAMQYLIHIWQIRPDLNVVSSSDAAQLLKHKTLVLSTWQAAPVLLTELPNRSKLSIESVGPDWLVLDAAPRSQDARLQTVIGTPSLIVRQPVTDGVTLFGYTITPSPIGRPVIDRSPSAIDVNLYWQTPAGDWPDNLAISVRPTLHGAFLPDPSDPAHTIIQEDVPRPAHGLFRPGDHLVNRLIADSYRLAIPTSSSLRADGVTIILYRRLASDFENLARVDLPVPRN